MLQLMFAKYNRNKMIYLDYNLFVKYIKDENLRNFVDRLKSTYIFPYSPAYLEEVANINSGDKNKDAIYIQDHIANLRNFSNYYELFPNRDGGTLLVREDPKDCLERVYNPILSAAAEKNMKLQHDRDFFNKYRREYNFDTKSLSSIKPKLLFNSPKIQNHLLNFSKVIFGERLEFVFSKSKESIWRMYERDHKLLETHSEIVFIFLELIGYHSERNKSNSYRSKTHDITHAIYGTQCKYFVSKDSKFIEKVKAVYFLFGTPCMPLSTEYLAKKKVC